MRALRMVMVLVLCAALGGTALAAPTRAPVPDPGVLAVTHRLDCEGVMVEKRLYDYDPENPEYWKSVGLGMLRERNFVQGTAEAPGAGYVWYVDANRDGWAEEVVEFGELVRRAEDDWCNVYKLYRKGR